MAEAGTLGRGGSVPVSDRESHHLRVRRGDAREEVRLVDGCGAVAYGQVEQRDGRATVLVERLEHVEAPAPLLLAVGAGDKDRFAEIVEKSVELDATRVVPLETERSLSVATRIRDKHRERMEQRALEALKQCGGAWIPALEDPLPLERFIALLGSPSSWPGPATGGIRRGHPLTPHELHGPRWLADPGGGLAQTPASDTPLVIAVGPEGGFTGPERERLLAAGFEPVRLGPHILRFETAAIAALSVAWQARQRGRHG